MPVLEHLLTCCMLSLCGKAVLQLSGGYELPTVLLSWVPVPILRVEPTSPTSRGWHINMWDKCGVLAAGQRGEEEATCSRPLTASKKHLRTVNTFLPLPSQSQVLHQRRSRTKILANSPLLSLSAPQSSEAAQAGHKNPFPAHGVECTRPLSHALTAGSAGDHQFHLQLIYLYHSAWNFLQEYFLGKKVLKNKIIKINIFDLSNPRKALGEICQKCAMLLNTGTGRSRSCLHGMRSRVVGGLQADVQTLAAHELSC